MASNKKQESVDWFIGKARTASGYRRNITEKHDRARTFADIGKMYFFYYDPKLKDKLPVYDKFPLVIPIERYADGFLGLNLHYLSTNERSAFLNYLMKYVTNKKMNENTKFDVSYDLLAFSRRLSSYTRPCVKRYLYDHVRSQFTEIVPNEWQKAIELPVDFFVYKR